MEDMLQNIKDLFKSYKIFILALTMGIIAGTFLSSYAYFSYKALQANVTKVNSKEKHLVHGYYEVSPHRTFDRKGPTFDMESNLANYNLVSILSDREETFVHKKDDQYKINFIDNTTLSISIYRENQEVFYQEYNGKFSRRGFFKFSKKRYSCIGIPFILGGCYHYKSRLALSKHGALLVQTAESNRGAFLFIFKKGFKQNRVYHFRRIDAELKV